ncbi:hypothetical protein T12_2298, partial [Trichinella patagoniensis]
MRTLNFHCKKSMLRSARILRLNYCSNIKASVSSGVIHVNAILSKQRNRLNLEMRGDLRLKLT